MCARTALTVYALVFQRFSSRIGDDVVRCALLRVTIITHQKASQFRVHSGRLLCKEGFIRNVF